MRWRSLEVARVGQAQVLRDTGKAILVRLQAYQGREVWVPQSVVHEDSEVYDAGEHAVGELVVLQWWAEREGLG